MDKNGKGLGRTDGEKCKGSDKAWRENVPLSIPKGLGWTDVPFRLGSRMDGWTNENLRFFSGMDGW